MSRVNFVLGVATAAALAAGGCSRGGNQPPPQSAYSYQENQQTHQTTMASEQTKTCPMAVPGTEVSMAETGNGIALSFTTDSGDINELRRRVYKVADQYRSQSSKLKSQQQQNLGPGWNTGGPAGQSGFGPQGPQNGPGTTTPGDTSGQGGTSGDISSGSSSGGSIGGASGSAGGNAGGSSGSVGGSTGGSTGMANEQMGTSGGANTGSQGQYGGDYGDTGQGQSSSGIGPQANVGSSNLTVPFNVYAQDIDRGARLLFTPSDPSQLEVLRSEVRQQASLMQPGQCPSPPISRR